MEFKSPVITKKGRELIAKTLSRNVYISFTKISLSSSIYADSQLETLSSLSNIKVQSKVQVFKNDKTSVVVSGTVNNAGLLEGTDINTVGIFAADPDAGEILYAVAIASAKGYLAQPLESNVATAAISLKIYIEVANANQVSISVLDEGPVNRIDFEMLENEIRQKTADFEAQISEYAERMFSQFMRAKVRDEVLNVLSGIALVKEEKKQEEEETHE